MQNEKEVLGYYISIAALLQIIDSMIPYPVVGIKLGLSNIVTLFVLNIFGIVPAIKVALLRPIVAGIVIGSLGNSMFVISFFSSILSTILMVFAFSLFKNIFSNIGISIIGAVGHNLSQLVIVYFMFISNETVFLLVPILILMGIIFGFITGYLVNEIISMVPKNKSIKKIFNKDTIVEKLDSSVYEGKLYFILFFIIILAIVLGFIIIKDIKMISFIFLFSLILKGVNMLFFEKINLFNKINIVKTITQNSKLKFFFVMMFGIFLINIISIFLYKHSFEQSQSILKNVLISILKLTTFILLLEELLKSKYLYNILKKVPMVFYSINLVKQILPEIKIDKKMGLKFILIKLLVKDVYQD